jgi:tetratricopeptide (TPR) repeat protein
MKTFSLIFIYIIMQSMGTTLTLSAENQLHVSETQDEQYQNQVKKGLRLFKEGRIDESEEVFENILDKNHKSLIAKEMLGIISYKKDEFNEAEKYAWRALKQNRRSAKAFLVLAGVANERKQVLAARDYLRKAKKFATEREKKFVADYIQKNNLKKLEQLKDLPAKDNNRDYNIKPAGIKPFIAVFAFEENNVGEEYQELGETIAEMLTTALIQSDHFQVLERAQLSKLLEEQALGLSGALDQETAIDIGKLIGVDAILVGNAGILKERIELDARIIDPEKGTAHVAASVSTEDETQLRNAVNDLARQLAATVDKIPVNRE